MTSAFPQKCATQAIVTPMADAIRRDNMTHPRTTAIVLLGMSPGVSPMLVAESESCVEGDAVPIITVLDPAIRTTGGIGLGSTLEEVLAAHPEAVEGASREPWRRFLIEGTPGTVVVDVAVASDPASWGALQNTVTSLNALIPSGPIGSPGLHGMNPSPCL